MDTVVHYGEHSCSITYVSDARAPGNRSWRFQYPVESVIHRYGTVSACESLGRDGSEKVKMEISKRVIKQMSDAVGELRKVEQISKEVANELIRAMSLHAPMHSAHEGRGVIEEEFDELWDEIKLREPSRIRMRAEAVQLAAMACRFIMDVCDKED